MSNFLNFAGNAGVTFKNHGTGGGTSFTLDKSASTNSVLLSIGGIIQKPVTDYSVSGTAITTTSSVTSGVEVFSFIIHDAGNAPVIEDNSVTGAKIALGSDAQGDVMYYNGTDWARLAAGTSGHFLKTQGTSANPAWAAAGGGFASQQFFTSSGTWTKPTGIVLIRVTVIGGGGGGGGGATDNKMGACGGGGGGSIEVIDVSSVSSVTVTIGAAGSAGSAGATGGTGGTSSFGSYCSAAGGTGGTGASVSGSQRMGMAGGAASGGDINVNGGYSDGLYNRNDGYNRPFHSAGSSPWGWGLGGVGTDTCTVAAVGTGYGAGGGAGSHNVSATTVGAAGTAGCCLVEEFK
tara:strand:- start:173 stop:1216 length:1044 start_codon:yes stop_codon:yes gene_type:complete